MSTNGCCVTIDKLEAFNNDNRGQTYELSNNRSTDMVLCYREKDSICGRHYHTGSSKNKDPEILYLIQGEVRLRYRYIKDDDIITETIVKAPAKITTPKYYWHELKTLTPAIFLELNSLFDGKDVIRMENI